MTYRRPFQPSHTLNGEPVQVTGWRYSRDSGSQDGQLDIAVVTEGGAFPVSSWTTPDQLVVIMPEEKP